jgi:hypothetical protein
MYTESNLPRPESQEPHARAVEIIKTAVANMRYGRDVRWSYSLPTIDISPGLDAEERFRLMSENTDLYNQILADPSLSAIGVNPETGTSFVTQKPEGSDFKRAIYTKISPEAALVEKIRLDRDEMPKRISADLVLSPNIDKTLEIARAAKYQKSSNE